VHNEVRSGGLSVITEDLKDRVRVDAHVRENRRCYIRFDSKRERIPSNLQIKEWDLPFRDAG
jgi:hypothetical protein